MRPTALPNARFQRILFCTDFSDNAAAVFPLAVDAALRRPDSTLFILHVIPEVEAQFWKSYLTEVDNIDAEGRRTINEKITADYLHQVPAGLAVKTEVRMGAEAAKILEYASENGIDLIVIGREGRTGWPKSLLGKVAEKIVRKATCPVLIVPGNTPRV